MQIRLIQRLVRLMQQGDVSELELEDTQAGVRVRLKRGAEVPAQGGPVVHVTHGTAAPMPVAAAPIAPAAEAPPVPATVAPGTPFVSPMVGTFYRASSPEAEPFVGVGSMVNAETTLCVIEAMKVMNEIKAETSGRIAEILVDNGEPVEFGQPLFLIAPA
jgi:acetyl-CoA carboxylase biotin carboxyl carrier protein